MDKHYQTFIVGCTLALVACMPTSAAEFLGFQYTGKQHVQATHSAQYTNPVLPGFYPDPSITRKGDDYYLVNSSFSYTPGLPIFHSKNLTDWTFVGYALSRASQTEFAGLGMSRGIFAPTLRYHDGMFYLITTAVDSGGNFIITAEDPAGPWSDPIWLPEVGGIDPDLFFDKDGKVYIAHNDAPPGEPLYDGHRAIWLWEYDKQEKKVKPDSRRLLVNGGVDITQQPVWIEGPHIYHINGWYYLTCAEGGTGPNHTQVVFRTRSLASPFEPYEHNPILTQRDLPYPRPNAVEAAGHADFIQAPSGEWWSVFLATRPYQDGLYNTGRETFLLPISWREGWPHILPPKTAIPMLHNRPTDTVPTARTDFDKIQDTFDRDSLADHWQGLRTFDRSWAKQENSRLVLSPHEPLTSKGTVAYVGIHQTSADFEVSTELVAPHTGESAGLVVFQNAAFHYFLGVTQRQDTRLVFVEKVNKGKVERVAELSTPTLLNNTVSLQIKGHQDDISFAVMHNNTWRTLGTVQDATPLSTAKAGGFVGATIGLHSRNENKD